MPAGRDPEISVRRKHAPGGECVLGQAGDPAGDKRLYFLSGLGGSGPEGSGQTGGYLQYSGASLRGESFYSALFMPCAGNNVRDRRVVLVGLFFVIRYSLFVIQFYFFVVFIFFFFLFFSFFTACRAEVVHVLTQEGGDHGGETERQRYRIYREEGSKAE
ncbi:hypothetical protein NU009_002524 [Salmonella enterica]|nr:hypothetical protein [Salmonella enterica subsp. enterica serovar Bonariensis]EJP2449343.1 hypothetical protein [Salmonella enterica]HCZ1709258.1 hypothetical protein [Salmonella enterica subsp. enterica serovar Montevideo str. 0269]